MQFAGNTLNHEKDANRTEEDLGIKLMDEMLILLAHACLELM